MRVFKLISGTVLAIVALNLATRALVGRSSALGLASDEFDAWGALDGNDTLIVYAHYRGESEAEGWTEPGDASAAGRERIATAFTSSGAISAVIYRPQSLGNLPDSLPDRHFILAPVVRRNVPLYAYSSAAAYAPGFIATRDQRWVWVFGWRKFGPPELSVS